MKRLDHGHLHPKLEVLRQVSTLEKSLSNSLLIATVFGTSIDVPNTYEPATWLPPVHVDT